jgi:hypothetical protein
MSSTTDLTFDFITDDQFRASLQSDHREIVRAAEIGAWKAIHVLAGSIIEALLVEYLVVSKIKPKGKDPMTVTLGEAIKACEEATVLSSRTSSLCDVIKDYRNLIHPGRLIRLQDQYGESSAQIVLALVEIITNEVALKRKENYGLTAEQIVRKISIDEQSKFLVPHLLTETKEYERRRLVEKVISEAYFAENSDWLKNETTIDTLKNCYRLALSSLPQSDQTKAAERFVKLVREESSEKITAYADAFFSCGDIQHLSTNDGILVKKYIFSRFEGLKIGGEFPADFLIMLVGIGPYLEDQDIIKFTNMCIRFVLSGVDKSQKGFEALLTGEYQALKTSELQTKVENHINVWLKFAKERNYSPERIERLQHLAVECSDIPF